jgi:sugar phosphate isomerase/epimerase
LQEGIYTNKKLDFGISLGSSLSLFKRVYLTSFGNITKASIVALKSLRKIAEQYNMERVELGFPYPVARVRDFSFKIKREIKDIVGSFKTTCHTPMINIASLDEKKRKENSREMIAAIEFAVNFGINQFVIHLVTVERQSILFIPLIKRKTKEKEELMRKAGEKSFYEIIDYFGKDTLIFGLENLTPYEPVFRDPQEFKHLFSKNVGLVLDTVHAISWKLNPVKLLDIYKNNLFEIHLTNGTGEGRIVKHYPLGRGKVPLIKVIRKLKEINFRGPMIVEVESEKDLIESLKWLNVINILKIESELD